MLTDAGETKPEFANADLKAALASDPGGGAILVTTSASTEFKAAVASAETLASAAAADLAASQADVAALQRAVAEFRS